MEKEVKLEKNLFFKQVTLVLIFFTVTPITLFASVLSLVSISNSKEINKQKSVEKVLTASVEAQALAPNSFTFPSISGEIEADDARPEIIKKYLEKYNSPMTPYAKYIVETSDKYNLDYRLLTAIAQKESGLGRAMPSENCNNAWGYGIHSEGILCFDSWEEGIETVARGLKENYIDKGFVTVEQIMKKYAHPSSTTWAEGVLQYMSQMQ